MYTKKTREKIEYLEDLGWKYKEFSKYYWRWVKQKGEVLHHEGTREWYTDIDSYVEFSGEEE